MHLNVLQDSAGFVCNQGKVRQMCVFPVLSFITQSVAHIVPLGSMITSNVSAVTWPWEKQGRGRWWWGKRRAGHEWKGLPVGLRELSWVTCLLHSVCHLKVQWLLSHGITPHAGCYRVYDVQKKSALCGSLSWAIRTARKSSLPCAGNQLIIVLKGIMMNKWHRHQYLYFPLN